MQAKHWPESRAILLLMQADPMLEWRRLTEHYREMSDGELRELDADFANLTDTAQQMLRAEMKSRGLGETGARKAAPLSRTSVAPATIRIDPERAPDNPAVPLGNFGRTPMLVPDEPDGDADDEAPHDYTWKTVLCDCDTNEQAHELSAALRQAGVDSWIQQAIELAANTHACLLPPISSIGRARSRRIRSRRRSSIN